MEVMGGTFVRGFTEERIDLLGLKDGNDNGVSNGEQAKL
jgi:hypothetical protein